MREIGGKTVRLILSARSPFGGPFRLSMRETLSAIAGRAGCEVAVGFGGDRSGVVLCPSTGREVTGGFVVDGTLAGLVGFALGAALCEAAALTVFFAAVVLGGLVFVVHLIIFAIWIIMLAIGSVSG